MLEGSIGSFVAQAREELKIAEQSGHPEAIDKARTKDFAAGSAMFKNRWRDEDLRNYFQTFSEAFK
jgi:hypothetical protein